MVLGKGNSKNSSAIFPSLIAGPDECVDFNAIQRNYGESGQQLFKLFLRQAPLDLAKLRDAYRESRQLGFRQAVHGFKGVCGTMYAGKMRTTCVELERAAREGAESTIPVLLQRLDREMGEAQEFLECKIAQTSR